MKILHYPITHIISFPKLFIPIFIIILNDKKIKEKWYSKNTLLSLAIEILEILFLYKKSKIKIIIKFFPCY